MEFNTRGRVPVFLRMALEEEIRKITSGMTFKQPLSEERAHLSVFGQSLPIPEKKKSENKYEESIAYEEEESEEYVFKCPWCVVRIIKGSIEGPNADVSVLMGVEFGIFDDDLNNQGSDDINNLIWKVYERFSKDPLLANQYTCECNFDFALQEEETYPYFFGAITMNFTYPGIQRESGGKYI